MLHRCPRCLCSCSFTDAARFAAYVCDCAGHEIPPAPFQPIAGTLVMHKAGKTYQVAGTAHWTVARGWRVGVYGMRDGKRFGPWRMLPLASLRPLA